MPANFKLVLDTAAPRVEWGYQQRVTAGEVLRVAYTTDEPIAAAWLELPDGRKLAMTVERYELSVLLPPDAAVGVAAVIVSDDVGNETRYPAVVLVAGVVVTPPLDSPPTAPFRGRPARTPERRRIATRSVLTARSVERVRGTSKPRQAAASAWSSSTRVRAQLRDHELTPATSSSAVRVRATGRTVAQANVGAGHVTRGDGPELLAALELLGVL